MAFDKYGLSGSVVWNHPDGISATQGITEALAFIGNTQVKIGIQSASANPVVTTFVVIGV